MPPCKSITAKSKKFWVIVLATNSIMAYALAQNFIFSTILLGALSGIILLEMPASVWVTAAVLSATLSRFLECYIGVPGIVNFVHFPIALVGALYAVYHGEGRSQTGKTIGTGLAIFLLWSYISLFVNSGELFRPFMAWLVFLEPFLIIYALLKARPSVEGVRMLWGVLIFILLIQIPTGFAQFILLGAGDFVQGTFAGMGAGHHVCGGLVLVGALLCVVRGLYSSIMIARWQWLGIAAILFVIAVLSDSRQMIVAFLPCLLYALLISNKIQIKTVLFLTPLVVLTGLIATYLHSGLSAAVSLEKLLYGFEVKARVLEFIIGLQSERPWSLLLGLGGGNSVGRVAFLSMAAKASSPIQLLGLSASPTAQEIWLLSPELSPVYARGSSAYGVKSTWLALYGDFGPLGLGLYLWMSIRVWLELKKGSGWESISARAAILLAATLGVSYSWMEEPGFVLPVALIVGLAIVSHRHRAVEGQTE